MYFKKYLTNHKEHIKKYCELKEKLAEQYPEDRPKYTQGKNEFIAEVIKAAKEEYND